ncbi:YciI family protein [Cohnella faecalis]|uniref:YCII-related domain-containing protein n=1 Tax=Cohnella faecalis TaxID=2315694 RepID=A0A398D0M1_9BACL|nr:YciI family protein [Cohnella faecalis]RIE05041.1 hypothetical protein D3H35_02580 [Cohnella faecalis]
MRYYIVFLQTIDAAGASQYQQAHFEYQSSLRLQGVIFAHGRLTDGWGGVAVYRAGSEADVRLYVEEDPFVRNGIRSYEIHEWDMKLAPDVSVGAREEGTK